MKFFKTLPRRLRRFRRRYLGDYSELDNHPGLRLRLENSHIHGTGAFATEDIKAGELIIEYIGELIPSAEGTIRERRSLRENGTTYIMSIDENWDIDGSVNGGEASYLNHSCEPNCAIEIDTKRRRAWIAAFENITKDDELTFDYYFDPMLDPLVECKCGAKNCRGYFNYFTNKGQMKQRMQAESIKSENGQEYA